MAIPATTGQVNVVSGLDEWLAPPYTGPTTDEMDHTTAEERYQLVALCATCRNWHHFTGSPDRFSQTTGEVCRWKPEDSDIAPCGGTGFVGGTLISERTWRPDIKKPVVKKR